jgi:peptidoglycan LD-endopeptidase CwlK
LSFTLDPHSVANLQGVHPDLVRVVYDCAANGVMPFTFGITQGLRTQAMQKVYVAAGKSETMNSRHLDGHAVDMVVLIQGQATWSWPMYEALNVQMQAAAARCGVPVTWGGSWTTLKDGCHFELPRDKYPSTVTAPETTTA